MTAGAGLRLAAGLTHLLTGRAITLVVQFVTLALMGRALGPADFGTIQLGVAIFLYVGFVNDLGLTIVGAREFGRPSPTGETRGDLLGARIALTLAALVPVVVVLGGPFDSSVKLVGIILAAGFALSSVSLRWLLQATERFARIAAADTFGAAVQLGATLALVHRPGDVVGAAIAVVIGPAISTLLMLPLAPLDRSLVPRFRSAGLALIRRALPLGIATIATAVYYSLDSVLLGIFRGSADVGYYAAAYRIVLGCLTVPFLVHAAALPLVSRLSHDAPGDVPGLIASVSRGILLVAVPIAVGTTILGDMITRLAFGPDFGPAATPLRILIWTCVSVSANVPFAVLLLARRRDRIYMLTTILGAAANFAANLLMIPAFGTLGASVTTLLAEALVLGSILWHTRDISVRILALSIAGVAPPTFLMALSIVGIRESPWAIPVGCVVFGVAALVFRSVTVTEVRAFIAALVRTPAEEGDRQT